MVANDQETVKLPVRVGRQHTRNHPIEVANVGEQLWRWQSESIADGHEVDFDVTTRRVVIHGVGVGTLNLCTRTK